MNYRLLMMYFAIIALAQSIAWYQSNSLLLWDWLKDNYIPIVVCTSPIVGLAFTYSTKIGYGVLDTLWAVRFSAFATVVYLIIRYLFGGRPEGALLVISVFFRFLILFGAILMWQEDVDPSEGWVVAFFIFVTFLLYKEMRENPRQRHW